MIYAVYCNPGPGDILRYFHGLSEMSIEKKEHVVFFCLEQGYQNAKTLLQHLIPFCNDGIHQNYVAKNVTELNYLLRLYAHGSVFYCFENDYFEAEKKILIDDITKGVIYDFVLLDRYNNQQYIRNKFFEHLTIESNKIIEKNSLLFVRISPIIPNRNLTILMFDEILGLCNLYGYNVKVAGSFLSKEYLEILKKHPNASLLYPDNTYPDYYQQICDYSQYSFAIGMNSGGLDLAAASGIPVLRIGEFHHRLSYGSIHYNDFLAWNRTVNILSNYETDITNITFEVIEDSLQILLSNKKAEIIYV